MAAEKTIDALCLGEPMYEFAERSGGGWVGGFGGDVSNVAVALARQGARAAVATRLGADAFGDELIALWRREGVSAEAAARDPERPTGVYFIRQKADGHHFEYRRAGSAASAMSPETLPREALEACRVLHVSGISQAISARCEAAVAEAIRIVKAAGGLVSFDPNLRLKLWPLERARAAIHGAMASADIALPGLDDARMLTGLDGAEEIARFYLDLGPSIVALTLGAEGALVATRDGAMLRIPPRPTVALDASGAGDCFDGAFLAEWLRTGDPEAAGRYAVTAASLSVEGVGAAAPIPRADAVRKAMAAQETGAQEIGAQEAGAQGAAAPAGPRLVAMIAHDALKPALAAWASEHRDALKKHPIVATGTTAGVIREAAPELQVTGVRSGPLGGDQQIGGMMAEGRIRAMIFFCDPLTAMPHDVDVKALLRIALVTDTPCAFSRSTADLLVKAGAFDAA